jgi:hypothetical protein
MPLVLEITNYSNPGVLINITSGEKNLVFRNTLPLLG